MSDSVFRIVMFILFICISYFMGKKDSFDKGYTQGFDGGYDEGYEEGQNDVLKQIYGIDKNAKHDTVTLKGKQF